MNLRKRKREKTEWELFSGKLCLYIPFSLLTSPPSALLSFLLDKKLLPMRAEFYYTEQLLCYDCLSACESLGTWDGIRIYKMTLEKGLLTLKEKQ